VEPGAVKVHGIGINHLTYLTRISVHGEDAFPAMRAELLKQKKDFPTEIAKKKEWTFYGPKGPRLVDNPFGWEIFETYGVYPIPPDRHIAEYYPERFIGGAYYGGKLGVNAYSIERTIEHGDRDFAEMIKLANATGDLPRSYYERVDSESEQLVGIMESLLQDGEREFSVNVPNTGFAPQLPLDAVLETSASAQLGGFVPLAADPLPEDLVRKLRQRIETVELTVDAALSGDKAILIEALLLDGAVTDAAIARKLAQSLIDAHRPDLPQFAA
jgi:alpha-galactosidase